LLNEDALTMENGCKDEYLSDFFGYFFIRKCMWSTQDTVKSTIANLKKFYRLSKEDYEEFTDTICANKEYWIDCCSEYNDGISEW
jgi:predicted nucleic-acid-binding protein